MPPPWTVAPVPAGPPPDTTCRWVSLPSRATLAHTRRNENKNAGGCDAGRTPGRRVGYLYRRAGRGGASTVDDELAALLAQVDKVMIDFGYPMGPFAVDEGLFKVTGREAVVRIHNTNTKKIIQARFNMDEGLSEVDGDLTIPGVSGTGSIVAEQLCRLGFGRVILIDHDKVDRADFMVEIGRAHV